jgi:ATP-dependent protease ClpP protease subunit
MSYRLAQGRNWQLRLPLSPVRAEMALRALENWRESADEGHERRWYRIANAAEDGTTQINIFDEVSWWGISAEMFVGDLAQVKGPVEVHINSPGGDYFDGITIFNALAGREGVKTVADGLAASAASLIFMAGQEREAKPGSMVMIHDALGMTLGNEADHLETARVLGKVSGEIAAIYAARAGRTAGEWRDAMRGEAWYTSAEAKAAGLATKGPDGDDPAGASWDRSVFAAWQGDVVNWDGPAAMSAAAKSDDPAKAYAAICAGRREGDPDKQSSWALPHHAHPGDGPDEDGVRNALSRLPQTDGLTNASAAEAHLKAHLKALGGEPSDHAGMPAWLRDLTAPKEAATR